MDKREPPRQQMALLGSVSADPWRCRKTGELTEGQLPSPPSRSPPARPPPPGTGSGRWPARCWRPASRSCPPASTPPPAAAPPWTPPRSRCSPAARPGAPAYRPATPTSGWYVREGDHREREDDKGKPLRKICWALEATIATTARPPRAEPACPNLAISPALTRPGEDPGGTGARVLASAAARAATKPAGRPERGAGARRRSNRLADASTSRGPGAHPRTARQELEPRLGHPWRARRYLPQRRGIAPSALSSSWRLLRRCTPQSGT